MVDLLLLLAAGFFYLLPSIAVYLLMKTRLDYLSSQIEALKRQADKRLWENIKAKKDVAPKSQENAVPPPVPSAANPACSKVISPDSIARTLPLGNEVDSAERIPEREPVPNPAKKSVPPLTSVSAPAPEPLSELPDRLREWKILPPKDLSFEETVMQWWAPRLGGVLGVLAMIFFAVWSSQFSTPLVRVSEMLAVSVGITGAGLYFRRRRNVSFGGALTATGTTMFYFVALAAGTFPATRIFDHAGVALAVQVLAILPTLILGRGRFIPTLAALVFACISALFAVCYGSGMAALVTSFGAYAVAAWFCTKKEAPGLLLAGAIGAFLPLWVMSPQSVPESASVILAEARNLGDILALLLGGSGLPAYLIAFAAGIILPNCVLLKSKSSRTFANLVYAASCIHALVATGAGLKVFTEAFGVVSLPEALPYTLPNLIGACFLSTATLLFGAAAWTSFRRFRENKFLFTFNFVAGSIFLPLAILLWLPADSGKDVLFYALLAEGVLLAYSGRALNSKWTLLSLLCCLLLVPLVAFRELSLFQSCLFQALRLGCLAWFFGEKEQWSGDLRIVARLAIAVVALVAGVELCGLADSFELPVAGNFIFPLACLAVLAAGTFLPRITRLPFAVAGGVWIVFIYYRAFVQSTAFHGERAWWLYAGVVVMLSAVCALRWRMKDVREAAFLELAFVAPMLAMLSMFFLNAENPAWANAVFFLPLAALLAGTPWRRNAAFPLARRSADISALPLIVFLFAELKRWDSGALLTNSALWSVPAVFLVYCFVPLCFSATRELLRERPWFAVSASASGSACLMLWGYQAFPRLLSSGSALLALALILAGLLARVRSVRLVGAAVLVIALARLFICDISDTIGRIIAFAAVGLLLFLLGFAYQAFARRIGK